MWSSSLSSPSLSFLGLYPRPPTPASHLLTLWWGSDLGFPGGTSDKESACQCRRHKRCGFDPWARKIPWSRKRHPTPVFFLKNPLDRRAWRATVHGVANSQTRLSTHKRKAVISLEGQPCDPTCFWEASAGGLTSSPGRLDPASQLRVCMPERCSCTTHTLQGRLKIEHATAKTQCAQPTRCKEDWRSSVPQLRPSEPK